MRFLHTSDWHLGRSLHGQGLLNAQAAYLDSLVEVVRSERVDAVLVSGDVYDRALPPVDAVDLLADVLRRLADARVRVVLTSGNHDSPTRLGFAAGLIDAAGVHLRTRPDQVGRAVVLADDHGEVAVHALPYLEPDVVREPWALAERSHTAALTEAMRRVRSDLATRPGARSVVLSHAFVGGGQACDSERDIAVGGVGIVPATVFEGVDYVALGHLHGAQVLDDAVRYSGSPLAYSFSEAGHRKVSWLVDLGRGGALTVQPVPAPVPRRLRVVRGRLDDLLTAPSYDDLAGCWLQVTLTDPARPRAAMERLRQRFPHVLVLLHEPAGVPGEARSWAERLRGRSPHETTLDFVRAARGVPATDAESALLGDAVEACSCDEVAG